MAVHPGQITGQVRFRSFHSNKLDPAVCFPTLVRRVRHKRFLGSVTLGRNPISRNSLSDQEGFYGIGAILRELQVFLGFADIVRMSLNLDMDFAESLQRVICFVQY